MGRCSFFLVFLFYCGTCQILNVSFFSLLVHTRKKVRLAKMSEEQTVSLVDVLQEDEELEEEASAVLAGSDSDHCSYPQVRLAELWTI